MAFTFFFRDGQILELLVEQALPSLHGQSRIHVWDAGCAHGPEPYSLAILLRQRMSDVMFRNVKIHATDVDGTFATTVARGIFPDRELKRMPAELFRRYFRPADQPGHFQAVDEIRSKIQFSVHDLLSLQPIREGLSLVVCKNVLLHFDEAQRCNILRMFHRALRDDGVLAMEHTQKMPDRVGWLFRQAGSNGRVYSKAGHAESSPAPLPACHCIGHHVGAAAQIHEGNQQVFGAN